MKIEVRRLLLVIFISVVFMTTQYTAAQYIKDVTSGKQVACKWVKLAVERHLNDLKRAEKKDPDFPYYFDEKAAKRVIDFKQQLRHTQGEWANPRLHDTRIRLEPWQQFIDWVLFGWRREGGYRRFNKSYIEVAKKNGKTTGAAATANYCFLVDQPREIGPEIYCIATKKDQARKAWDEMKNQIEKDPFLRNKTRVYKQHSTIVIPGTPAKVRLLGKDSKTEDGLNPHFTLVDEYHAHPDNSMLEVMESAEGAREQPLIYIITTSGFNKDSACYQEEHMLSERVLEGSADPKPENFFCIIFTLDEEDDWTDPKVWIKSNPNIGVSLRWEFLEDRIKSALHSPAKQNKVKTKNLNIWTQAETRWILDEVWMKCNFPVDPEALLGRSCFGGMDLSASQDITAIVYTFPPLGNEELYQQLYRFFIPGDNIIEREQRDKVSYSYWVEKGLVIATPGDVIDYDFIEQQFLEDAGKYDIQETAYDPWRAHEVVNHMTNEGLTMVPIRQSYFGMASPTDIFEKKVLGRKVAHGGNPIMRWMVSCTEVKSDRQGNIMPMKPRRETTGKRIDGVTAGIMSLGRAAINTEPDASIEVFAV
jgi:phage terminase large subunit-like protein